MEDTSGVIKFNSELGYKMMKTRVLTQKFNKVRVNNYNKKIKLIKKILGSMGTNVTIQSPFTCDVGENIHIDNNTFINYNCTIIDTANVYIGKNCMIAPNVSLYTAYHSMDAIERRKKETFGKNIVIGDDVWIGASAIILPGITVGNGSIIGAGSVVTKDVLENTVVAGNPAKIMRKIEAK